MKSNSKPHRAHRRPRMVSGFYGCPYCSHTFVLEAARDKHLRNAHPEEV